MSHLLGVGVVLVFIIPHSSSALMMVNPLLCLFYQLFKQNQVWNRKNLVVVIPILFTLLVNALQPDVNAKGVLAAVVLIMYFFCFPIVGECKLPNVYLYIAFSLILFSQLIYILNISFFVNLLNRLYPISVDRFGIGHMQNNITVDNMFFFRSGGLYRNPNDCARALTMLLAAFMVLNYNEKTEKKLFFVIPYFFAILLTGSRTGFSISSIIIILFLFQNKGIPSIWKVLILFFAIIVFVLILINGSHQFRGFNVVQGFGNSASPKLDVFVYYLSSENSVFRLLFGYLDNSRFEAVGVFMNYFDSDYGNLVYCYGFVGLLSMFIYFLFLFKKMNSYGRVFFVVLLWMISNSIITAYRTGFIFMLLLSTVYYYSKKKSS